MAISYEPLGYALLDKKKKLADLIKDGVVADSVTRKFAKNEHVSTRTLERICLYLDCKVEEIIYIYPDLPKQD